MPKNPTDRVKQLLEVIRKRPGMFLGYPNLSALFHTLSGYEYALLQDGYHDDLFDGFQDWVSKKYNINSSHNWSNIILFFSHGEEDAFNKFFELHDQFVREK